MWFTAAAIQSPLHYANLDQKGVIHLALGAVVNALWDLWSKSLGKPLWKLVADFTPEEFVRCIDFRYITDAITPEEAVKMLQDLETTKQQRVEDALVNRAVPAYTTSAGMRLLSLFVLMLMLVNRVAWVWRGQDAHAPQGDARAGI